jgi:tetratricopeptide (TPR) repeat protein
MTSIAKLKDRARKYEQKEDWRSAIEAYREVLEAEEAEDEIELELGLFNRVGDLYLRLGQTDEAVTYYQRAADKYAESGFYNNAIALCNKALRHRPDRPDVYLKLSRYCQKQGFLTDARRWILAYAERQVKRGQVEAALTALRTFVQEANAPDVRELLAQHLAAHDHMDEAIGQLRQAHAEWTRRGDDEAADRVAHMAMELDPDVDLQAGAVAGAQHADDLPGLGEPGDTEPSWERTQPEEAPAHAGLEGLETHRLEPEHAAGETDDAVGGLETFGQDAGEPPAPGDELAGAGVAPADAGTAPEVDDDEPEPLPLLDTGFEEEGGAEPDGLPLLDAPAAPSDGVWDEVADGVWDEVADGEQAEPDVVEDEELIEASQPGGAGEAAELDRDADEAAASEPVEGIDPAVDRPEMAEPGEPEGAGEAAPLEGLDLGAGFTVGGPVGMGPDWESSEEEPLILDLGGPKIQSEDALVDVDAVLNRAKELVSRGLVAEASSELRLLSAADTPPDKLRQALTVTNELVRRNPNDLPVLQRRVEFATRIGDRLLLVDTYMDLAEGLARTGSDTKARAMYLRVLGLDPENTAARAALGGRASAEEGPVDLEAILREMGGAEPAPPADAPASEGDEELAAMLSQFQARPGDAEAPEDAGAHYDLGLAFKEMGLIDEAIGEFQTALRAGEERLKAYEELGQCFMLKGQYTVAVKILRRALQAPLQSDADLLGVFYQLGQCHEELGQRGEAREAYEKVLAIDPDFEDVHSRVARL